MSIIKIVAIIIKDTQYLVARDHDEDFFKNVGGRPMESESDIECLRRELQSEAGYILEGQPEMVFELDPTPAVGNPGETVVLRGYLVAHDQDLALTPSGDVAEFAWFDATSSDSVNVAPQIIDLILPTLQEKGLLGK